MQKFFLVIPFFLIHIVLIAQSDSFESKINDNDDKIIQNNQKGINDSLNCSNATPIFSLASTEYPSSSFPLPAMLIQ